MKRNSVALALVAGIILIYAPALALPFLGDDIGIVERLHYLGMYGKVWEQVANDFSSTLFEFDGNYYRPLVTAAFALDYSIWQANPLGYHLTNLFLHVANCLLLYGIALRLIPASRKHIRLFAAALAALVFALRPSNSEVVLWVSGRGDSLATLGILLAVYGYLCARGRLNGWYALAMAGFAFGLGSKEAAATLPAALVGLHLFGFVSPPSATANGVSHRARLRFAIRNLLPFGLMLAGYFLLRRTLFGSFTHVYDTPPTDWANPEWVAFKVASLRYFLTPRFAPGWDTTLVNYAMLLLLGAGTLLTLLSSVVRKLWAFGWLWVLSVLLPALPQLFVNSLGEGERLVYLPTAPLALIVAAPLVALAGGAQRWARARTVLARAATVALVLVLLITTGWTVDRTGEWATVGAQMNLVIGAIREEASQMPAGQTRLLLVPGAIDGVLFARNGQGALMGPPLQPGILLGPILVAAPEVPCQPPSDLTHPISDAKCWNVAAQRFEPFDRAAYRSEAYPYFWLLDDEKLKWLPHPESD